MPEVIDSKFGELYLNDEGRVAVMHPDTGEAFTVPAADAERIISSGYRPMSADTAQQIERNKELEKHKGSGSTAQAFVEGAARGVLSPFVAAASALPESLGGVPEGMDYPSAGDVIEGLNRGALESSDAISSAFSGYRPEDVRSRAEANPVSSAVGGLAGELALFGAGGRLAGAGAKALGYGAKAAEGVGVGADVGSAAMRSSFGRRLLAQAAKEGSVGALQGAVSTAGLEHEAAYRERRAVDADALLSQMGMGAVIGGVLGVGLGVTAEATRTAFGALKRTASSGARYAEEGAIQGARGISPKTATDIGYGLGIAGKAASRTFGPIAQVAGTAANFVFRRIGGQVAERRAAVAAATNAARKAELVVEKASASRASLFSELDDLAAGTGAKKPEFATSAARLESAKTALSQFEASIPRRLEAMERKHVAVTSALESEAATAHEAFNNITATAKRNADGAISHGSASRIERARANVTKAENALMAEKARQKSAREFIERTKIPEQRARLAAKVETVQAKRAAQERLIRSKVSSVERELGDAGKALDLAHEEIDKHIRGSLTGPTEQFLTKVGRSGARLGNAGIQGRRAFNRQFAALMAGDKAKVRKPPSVELEEHVENGRKALNRSIDHAFGTLGGQYKPSSGVGDYTHFADMQFRAPGESPRDAFVRRSREVSMRTQDIMATSDEIARTTSGLDTYAPALGMKVRDSATKALVLLNTSLQPVGGNPNALDLGGESGWIPATTIDQAERMWNGTMFPGQMMDEFATWTMSPETVLAASSVYPDMVQQMRESVVEKMAEGWKPTIKQQRQISLLTGAKPVQATPEYQLRYQGYVSSQAPPQQPAVKPGDTGSPTIAQSFRTLSQSSMNIGSNK